LPPGEQVIDTVGAGDTFVAVIIAQLFGKEPMQLMDAVKALIEANTVCAKKVCMQGMKGLIRIDYSEL
jgi:sugar/nucleoside kinase (ribokinase family)